MRRYAIVATSGYRRAYKRISKHKNFKREALDRVINTLASGKKLEKKYQDHELSGKLRGYRECHIQNDILLVYKIQEEALILVLVDLDSHSSLFG